MGGRKTGRLADRRRGVNTVFMQLYTPVTCLHMSMFILHRCVAKNKPAWLYYTPRGKYVNIAKRVRTITVLNVWKNKYSPNNQGLTIEKEKNGGGGVNERVEKIKKKKTIFNQELVTLICVFHDLLPCKSLHSKRRSFYGKVLWISYLNYLTRFKTYKISTSPQTKT